MRRSVLTVRVYDGERYAFGGKTLAVTLQYNYVFVMMRLALQKTDSTGSFSTDGIRSILLLMLLAGTFKDDRLTGSNALHTEARPYV